MDPIRQLPLYGGLTDCNSFITITLKPHMFEHQIRQQYRKTFNQLNKLLSVYTLKHLMVCEITKQGNIHFHVLCLFDPQYNQMVEDNEIIEEGLTELFLRNEMKLKKEFGFIDIQRTINPKKVFDYIIKDIPKTRKFINPTKSKVFLEVWTYRIWTPPKPPAPKLKHMLIEHDIEDEISDITTAEDLSETDLLLIKLGLKKPNNLKPKTKQLN